MSADRTIDQSPFTFRNGALILAAITLVVYLPALGGQFLWDDPDYVVNNLSLRSLHGLWQIWAHPSASPQYYPLVFSGFWFEYHLWGLHTFGYHAINLILHIGSALLIWRIMDGLHLSGGWLAAAIFALHPMNVESVAWISERKNVLSTVFYLWAALVYLRPFTRRRWTIALLLFVAALLSKSVAATWPAAMLVIFWWRGGRIERRDVIRLLPFLMLAAASGWFTAHVEHTWVGASAHRYSELDLSIADRLLIAGRAVCFYAAKLIVPWPLAFIYPRWNLDPHAAWQWIFPALAIASCLLPVVAFSRRAGESDSSPFQTTPKTEWANARIHRDRGVSRSYLTAVLLFVGTLFPALGFINVYPMRYSFVADHFAYLATPALIVPIAVLLTRRFGSMSALVLIPCALITAFRTPDFSNPLQLWSDTMQKNPNSWMVCTNLANVLNAQRQVDAAGDLYLRAYQLAPSLYATQTDAAIVLARRGQTDRAIALLESSARIDPDYPFTYYNWGQVLENNGDPAGALEKFRKAAELAPEFPAVRQRIAALESQLRRSSIQGSRDPSRQ